MGRLDIGNLRDSAPPNWPAKNRAPLAIIAVLLIFVFIFLSAWYFFLKPAANVEEKSGKIDILLDSPKPFFEGSPAIAKAFSSCGPFTLYLDSGQIAIGETSAEVGIAPSAGSHTLQARGQACSSSLDFQVLAKQCDGNETAPCSVDGCEGVKSCFDGIYSGCMMPKKICVPGEKTGCSTDGCKFGYSTCNACGTGFGKCLPPEGYNATNSSQPCTGGNCA